MGTKIPPELILFIGRPGSGKSTFFQKHYVTTHTYVSQDEQGKGGHRQLFEDAVSRNESIVIDRQNHIREQRKYYLDYAKQNGYTTKIVEFKVPKDLCERRILDRKDHPTISNKDNVRGILNQFDRSYQGVLVDEANSYEEVKQKFYAPIQDLSTLQGLIAVVGDAHGVWDEVKSALEQIKPDHVIFVGDVCDRGPNVEALVDYIRNNSNVYTLLGNHEHKWLRSLKGNKVSMGGGLEMTTKQFEHYTSEQKEDLYNWLKGLPLIIKLPKDFVAVHAGLNPERSLERQHFDTCIYIRNHGGKKFDDKNQPKWYEWPLCEDLKKYKILFGHAIHEVCNVAPNIFALDKGAVYGTGLRIMVIDTEGEDTIHEYPTQIYYNSTNDLDRNAKAFKVFVAPWY